MTGTRATWVSTSAGSVAAFTKIAALGEKGDGALTRSITGDNAIPTFTSKKTAFLISGPWAIADIKKAGIHYDITPVPAFSRWSDGVAVRRCAGVLRGEQGQEQGAGHRVRDQLRQHPGTADRALPGQPPSAGADRGADQVESTDPDIQKWFDAGKSGTPMPNIPAMAAIWDPFGKAEAAIIGGADVKSTLDAAQKAITTAIAK